MGMGLVGSRGGSLCVRYGMWRLVDGLSEDTHGVWCIVCRYDSDTILGQMELKLRPRNETVRQDFP